ncbi:WD repeat-containing protein 6-like [Lolium rigidum]|uniref:WD repeat-containing protein 6-like n=1 Tax=Lolium rigidum TaxID=89674 RepID=UPI001F5CD459|nr:WD repeat-containing protein 6-like [Lolium rigidum]
MAAGDHHLRLGSYLGDVSALSFLPSSPRPLLLAGTGSELLVYDVDAASFVASFKVFDGVRVHGIQPRGPPNCSSADGLTVAVFGERRAKLLRLRVDAGDDGGAVGVRLELEQRLPGFDHWVLDACFLEVDGLLAIGLSDNSVALWDLTDHAFVTRVNSPEKCLLYSMRMWGDSVKSLLVASGTILNEILIWKLVPWTLSSSLLCTDEVGAPSVENRENVHFTGNRYMAVHIGRLKEHEGSIFRISWSSDGSKFMSVSDDRSARMWMLSCQPQNFTNQAANVDNVDIIPKLTLFGHSARIWDCYISDSIVITAGEDCTCCIWDMDGKLIKMFKEHIGRGLWRCLYDPSSLVLITAGFDSAIKVHHLRNSSFHDILEEKVVPDGLKYESEVFEISSPIVSGQYGPLDSKSEYVRCLHFVQENVLYVATNNGYLHHADLSDTNDVRWTEVIQVTEKAPIICMDVMTVHSDSLDKEDIVALGDGHGNVTIVRLTSGNHEPKVDLSFTWSAEKDRQLLGIHWCKSLECSHIFTADPRGVLKLWNIRNALYSNAHALTASQEVSLVAVFESPFGARIMCLDVSLQDEILIAGDKKGNIVAFPFHKTLAAHDSSGAQQKITFCDRFKGAHGISSVTSVHITTSTSDDAQIHTTGGDGCICFFKYGRYANNVEFVGMRQLKDLGTIQSIYADHVSDTQLVGTYAIGFTSADFVIWDLGNDAKMVQISCGGWRRPYSYYLGTVPEYQNCFAFVKDHSIHVRRHWAPAQDKKLLPQVLHTQFHGREVHSLCFIDPASYSHHEKSTNLWIATGCEDGTVRLTGYSASNAGRWCSSKMLGEHVGGSAVRDTCFITKTYTLIDKSCNSNGSSRNILVENEETTFLLISVGSKQVLTTWILQPRIAENRQVCSGGLDLDSKQSSECSDSGDSAVTFQWLSTHMPPKLTTNRLKAGHVKQNFEEGNSSAQPNLAIMDQMENDWRYLSVTAFLLKHPAAKLTVCFAVVACSDATVILRALLLPSRLWFDVALLVPQASPVLVLRHIVDASSACSGDDAGNGDRYIIVSGSTDGTITLWDLTDTIHGFMQLVSETQPHMVIDCQKRPKTGRGSQGGRRRWRSLANSSVKKDSKQTLLPTEKDLNASCVAAESSHEISGLEENEVITTEDTMSSTHSCDVPEVQPMQTFSGVHQSGVNCLHVSEMERACPTSGMSSYCIISGGDDQAVQCIVFTLGSPQQSCSMNKASLNSPANGALTILSQHAVPSAHSSAVKGIWTDGVWAFSTGLDQRIRCWKMDPSGKFMEHSHVIISVPEPETLDVYHDRGRGKYHIVVAGRGMQMVEFSPQQDNSMEAA